MPSRLWACWAKMSRISAVRSTTSHSNALLQVALLYRGQRSVDDHDIDVEGLGEAGQLLGLALAEVGGRVGVALLDRPVDRFGPGRLGQQRQFVEAGLDIGHRPRPKGQSRQEGALPGDLEVGDGGGESAASPLQMGIGHGVM